VAGVRKWLATEGFLVTALRDGPTDLVRLPPESWESRDISGIEWLAVEAALPADALAGSRARLAACIKRLPEVSLLLQTGRDKEAMAIVVEFTDTFQSLTDILPFLGPDEERARVFAELTPPLRDLIAAFTNRDSVLIGDLLEYEVAPRLEHLLPTLGGPT
ncbi:MAG TPA: hypothetical protein VHE79_15365, partial [Spirochaetia bacterium]